MHYKFHILANKQTPCFNFQQLPYLFHLCFNPFLKDLVQYNWILNSIQVHFVFPLFLVANGPSLYFGHGIRSPVKPKPPILVLQVQHKDTQIRASPPVQTIVSLSLRSLLSYWMGKHPSLGT